MFTQLNQYHVVLEVKPDFQNNAAGSARPVRPDRRCAGGRLRAWWREARARRLSSGPTSSATASQASLNSTGSSSAGGRIGRSLPPRHFRTADRFRWRRSARSRLAAVPITINHQGQFPVVTLSFNLAPNASLGDAVQAVNKVKDDVGLPPSIQAAFQGTAEAFQASLANEPVLILAALVTVYIVLGVLYESYIHPLTILSTLPSAGVGALLALFITRSDFSVIALIGIVLLIGIVKKNAIMMIDFALEAERAGRQAAGRSHLSGLPAALPADHDDHHGGAAGRRAAGARHRHGLGVAASAGHHHRRRTDLQPDADALHHAGDLSVLRPAGRAILAAAPRDASRAANPDAAPQPSPAR